MSVQLSNMRIIESTTTPSARYETSEYVWLNAGVMKVWSGTAWVLVSGIAESDQNNFTARQTWQFGASLASAATITLGTDGNAFHITGTTTISDFTHIAGAGPFLLITDGILTFTHSAGVLETNRGASVKTIAGNRFLLEQDSDGTTWLLTTLNYNGIKDTADAHALNIDNNGIGLTNAGDILNLGSSGGTRSRISDDATINISVGGNLDFGYMSGMIIVNNHSTGGLAIFLVGSGNITKVASVASGTGSFSYKSSIHGYMWTGDYGAAADYSFMVFQTRPSA